MIGRLKGVFGAWPIGASDAVRREHETYTTAPMRPSTDVAVTLSQHDLSAILAAFMRSQIQDGRRVELRLAHGGSQYEIIITRKDE